MIRFILGIILGSLVIIFMVQNADSTQITLLFWTCNLSRAVMYLIIYILGFGSGFLIIGIRRLRKRKKKLRKEKEEANEKNEENEEIEAE